jgi:hypothetical protein
MRTPKKFRKPAPVKVVYDEVTTKSLSGVEYKHYKPRIIKS